MEDEIDFDKKIKDIAKNYLLDPKYNLMLEKIKKNPEKIFKYFDDIKNNDLKDFLFSNKNFMDLRDSNGLTLLHMACLTNEPNKVKLVTSTAINHGLTEFPILDEVYKGVKRGSSILDFCVMLDKDMSLAQLIGFTKELKEDTIRHLNSLALTYGSINTLKFVKLSLSDEVFNDMAFNMITYGNNIKYYVKNVFKMNSKVIKDLGIDVTKEVNGINYFNVFLKEIKNNVYDFVEIDNLIYGLDEKEKERKNLHNLLRFIEFLGSKVGGINKKNENDKSPLDYYIDFVDYMGKRGYHDEMFEVIKLNLIQNSLKKDLPQSNIKKEKLKI